MTAFHFFLFAAAAAIPTVSAFAADTVPVVGADRLREDEHRDVLTPSERRDYQEVFAAIRTEKWAEAAARLDGMKNGPLHHAARAELYLAKNSPSITAEQAIALLEAAPDLPHAPQLARLAQKRGAQTLPYFAQPQELVWGGSQPRRARPKSIRNDPVAVELDGLAQPLIVADQPAAAESLFNEREADLTPEARTEFLQRIAWSYYNIGADTDARRLADRGRAGIGEWAIHAAWVSGLASWRLGDCDAAADAFATVGARATDQELASAGHYWAARADMMCARPENVQARLRAASRMKETFYGLIAASALGIRVPNHMGLHDFSDAEWRPIADKPNVRTAIALVEIGEIALADTFIKHQARITPGDHGALIHLATDLNLPATQYWLAHNVPAGTQVNVAARYPKPDWRPSRGWRVDQKLAYAHALQESNFRASVVSSAGAVGVMQVRPGTAGDIARSREEYFDPSMLRDPSANLEFGQSYIEYLRNHEGTNGLLPKVIAAYNAGPKPISEWNYRGFDRGDPLLYIESIPYWETRGYVPIVLRNYWIYEQQMGEEAESRKALAQGLWPRFPGLPGPTALRLTGATQQAGTGSK